MPCIIFISLYSFPLSDKVFTSGRAWHRSGPPIHFWIKDRKRQEWKWSKNICILLHLLAWAAEWTVCAEPGVGETLWWDCSWVYCCPQELCDSGQQVREPGAATSTSGREMVFSHHTLSILIPVQGHSWPSSWQLSVLDGHPAASLRPGRWGQYKAYPTNPLIPFYF